MNKTETNYYTQTTNFLQTSGNFCLEGMKKTGNVASKVFTDLIKIFSNPFALGTLIVLAIFAPKICLLALIATIFITSLTHLKYFSYAEIRDPKSI